MTNPTLQTQLKALISILESLNDVDERVFDISEYSDDPVIGVSLMVLGAIDLVKGQIKEKAASDG